MSEYENSISEDLSEEEEETCAESPPIDLGRLSLEIDQIFPGVDHRAKLGQAIEITRDYAGAEEVLQNVYRALTRLSAEKRQGIESMGAYVSASVRRAALKWVNQQHRMLFEELSEDTTQAASHLNPDPDFVTQLENEDEVDYLLAKIPKACREVYVYVNWDGYTMKEISALTGVKVNTLRKRLKRAALRLAKECQRYRPEQHRRRSKPAATHSVSTPKEPPHGKR